MTCGHVAANRRVGGSARLVTSDTDSSVRCRCWERALNRMLGEENEPPYLRPCGPQEPSPDAPLRSAGGTDLRSSNRHRNTRFARRGPISAFAAPAAHGSFAVVTATPAAHATGPVGSPRPIRADRGKGVTFGHVAERRAVLRGWLSDTDSTFVWLLGASLNRMLGEKNRV